MNRILLQENCGRDIKRLLKLATNLVIKLVHILQTKIPFFTGINQNMKNDLQLHFLRYGFCYVSLKYMRLSKAERWRNMLQTQYYWSAKVEKAPKMTCFNMRKQTWWRTFYQQLFFLRKISPMEYTFI